MGIERVLNEISSLNSESDFKVLHKKNTWPLLFIQDQGETFDSKVFKVRARLHEIFPENSIEIFTIKSTKLGATIGKLTEVGSNLLVSYSCVDFGSR